MSIVAGMDLGYGSQVKVVTSNYLVVNVGSSPTDAGAVNFLTVVNHKHWLQEARTRTFVRRHSSLTTSCVMVTHQTITSPSVNRRHWYYHSPSDWPKIGSWCSIRPCGTPKQRF